MSYNCAGCGQHFEGKPIRKPTEIERFCEIIQEEYRPGLVRVFTKEVQGWRIHKQENFCPSCASKVGPPKIVGFIETQKGGEERALKV